MPDCEKDLSNLTDLEREVVEQFVTRYLAIAKRAPSFRDTPQLTGAELRNEALGIALKQLDKRVAEFKKQSLGEEKARPSGPNGRHSIS